MRLGVSRRRRARLSLPGGVSRACVAVAGGTLLVIALSGSAGAGVLGPTGASGPPRYVSLGDSYTAGPLVPDQTRSPAGGLPPPPPYPLPLPPATRPPS